LDIEQLWPRHVVQIIILIRQSTLAGGPLWYTLCYS
jgi:hypothetical protein